MRENIQAVIPVRAGSRRLPCKNVALFQGETLLARKIKQLQAVPEIGGVTVTSDSADMLRIANDEGAATQKREAKYCDDWSVSFGDVVRHVCERIDCKTVVWACCTSPLIRPETYSRAIADYYAGIKNGRDSLMSVRELQAYLWDENGPVNYQMGLLHPISQDLPVLHSLTNGVFIAPRADMIKWRYFHGPNPVRFVISKREAADINDALDMAQTLAYAGIDA